MNIKSRLKRIEDQTKIMDDLCRCPDALALIGTPYAETCYKCAKTIDVKTWKSWQLIRPTTETPGIAFALKRDDNH